MRKKVVEFNKIPNERIFKLISNLIKECLGNNITNIIQVRTDKPIYKVSCGRKNFRVDLGKRNFESIKKQEIAYSHGIHVPRIYYYNNRSKVSDWIDGIEILYLNPVDKEEAIIKISIFLAKLHSIKNGDLILVSYDLNMGNFIFSNDRNVYLVDVDELKFVSNPVYALHKMLVKRIKDRKYIDLFLEEYSKYHDIKEIVLECEKSNWRWKKK